MRQDRTITDTTGDPAGVGRFVFVLAARCPVCNSRNLRTKKTRPRESDGSVTRETQCKECHHHFLVVIE
jgi:DNA-directed RNA polymerase subunit M/transcription elongation factor TFIIS